MLLVCKKHAINVIYDTSNTFSLTVLGYDVAKLTACLFKNFLPYQFDCKLMHDFIERIYQKKIILKTFHKRARFEVIILISDILRYLKLKW